MSFYTASSTVIALTDEQIAHLAIATTAIAPTAGGLRWRRTASRAAHEDAVRQEIHVGNIRQHATQNQP
jgi:hypothetical protein